MKKFIFLIEKSGYKFKVEASCGGLFHDLDGLKNPI